MQELTIIISAASMWLNVQVSQTELGLEGQPGHCINYISVVDGQLSDFYIDSFSAFSTELFDGGPVATITIAMT